MSLKLCPECKNEISDGAITCPECGAKQKRKTSLLTWAIASIIGIGIFSSCITNFLDYESSTTKNSEIGKIENNSSSSQSISASSTDLSKSVVKSKWKYSTGIEPASRKEYKAATLNANEKLYFDFPYHGGSVASITIRQHPTTGLDVILEVERGQFISKYEDCGVRIQFDDQPFFCVFVADSDDHKQNVRFLSQEHRLVAKMKKAKLMRIEAIFFQNGHHIMNFDVQGLEWESPSQKSKNKRHPPLRRRP